MNKGFIWVNGRGLGRYWMINATGTCSQCDYRGAFDPKKCRVGCNSPSQSLYHIPEDWMKPHNNLLIIFEEVGGDPTSISIKQVSFLFIACLFYGTSFFFFFSKKLTGGTVCASEEESESVTAYLKCDPNTYIRSIDFASFGTPTGTCGSFKKGSCHAASSQSVVEKLCLGRSRCSVGPTIENFGDPCPNSSKRLSIQLTCSK